MKKCCTCVGTCRGESGLGEGWFCVLQQIERTTRYEKCLIEEFHVAEERQEASESDAALESLCIVQIALERLHHSKAERGLI